MFKVGEKLNSTDGIVGTFVREFRATGIGYLIVVRVADGREYKAPSNEWRIKND